MSFTASSITTAIALPPRSPKSRSLTCRLDPENRRIRYFPTSIPRAAPAPAGSSELPMSPPVPASLGSPRRPGRRSSMTATVRVPRQRPSTFPHTSSAPALRKGLAPRPLGTRTRMAHEREDSGSGAQVAAALGALVVPPGMWFSKRHVCRLSRSSRPVASVREPCSRPPSTPVFLLLEPHHDTYQIAA